MATQGQRRQEAVAAVRRLRQIYRKFDTAGEKVERELDRLVKRKTLIGPDQLDTLGDRLNVLVQQVTDLQSAMVILFEIISALPR